MAPMLEFIYDMLSFRYISIVKPDVSGVDFDRSTFIDVRDWVRGAVKWINGNS